MCEGLSSATASNSSRTASMYEDLTARHTGNFSKDPYPPKSQLERHLCHIVTKVPTGPCTPPNASNTHRPSTPPHRQHRPSTPPPPLRIGTTNQTTTSLPQVATGLKKWRPKKGTTLKESLSLVQNWTGFSLRNPMIYDKVPRNGAPNRESDAPRVPSPLPPTRMPMKAFARINTMYVAHSQTSSSGSLPAAATTSVPEK
jgi:hypothetical protein